MVQRLAAPAVIIPERERIVFDRWRRIHRQHTLTGTQCATEYSRGVLLLVVLASKTELAHRQPFGRRFCEHLPIRLVNIRFQFPFGCWLNGTGSRVAGGWGIMETVHGNWEMDSERERALRVQRNWADVWGACADPRIVDCRSGSECSVHFILNG